MRSNWWMKRAQTGEWIVYKLRDENEVRAPPPLPNPGTQKRAAKGYSVVHRRKDGENSQAPKPWWDSAAEFSRGRSGNL